MKHESPYWLNGREPETPDPAEELSPWTSTTVVGTRMPRVDAYERVSGTAVYPHDVSLPDMLHAAILRCPHAHARIKSIDTAKAEKMPGVRAVVTGKSPGTDIPWYDRRGTFYGKLFDDTCRCEGEEVAAVAAETPLQAADAIRAIAVEYEVLPFVIDETAALEPNAPKLFPEGNMVGEPSVRDRGRFRRGRRRGRTDLSNAV